MQAKIIVRNVRLKPAVGLLVVLVSSALVTSAVAVRLDAAAPSATTIKTAFNKTLKRSIVVDGSGRTVYMFTADTGGTPNCTVKLDPICPKLWPPVKSAGAPLAGKGVVASKLATTTFPGGVTQVTYNRHPLYYFRGGSGYFGDKKPGDVKGQGLFRLWYVLSPKGTPIRR